MSKLNMDYEDAMLHLCDPEALSNYADSLLRFRDYFEDAKRSDFEFHPGGGLPDTPMYEKFYDDDLDEEPFFRDLCEDAEEIFQGMFRNPMVMEYLWDMTRSELEAFGFAAHLNASRVHECGEKAPLDVAMHHVDFGASNYNIYGLFYWREHYGN